MAYNFRIDMLSACSVMNKIFFYTHLARDRSHSTVYSFCFGIETVLELVAVFTRAQLANSISTT